MDTLAEITARLAKVPLGALGGVLAFVESVAAKSKGRSAEAARLAMIGQLGMNLRTNANKLEAAERAIVAEAWAMSGGNVSAAARLLCIERKAMERRVAAFGLKA